MRRENVSDLLAFLAVARERSFTKAGKKLGISLWHYLGSRFGVENGEPVPDLADVVRARCAA